MYVVHLSPGVVHLSHVFAFICVAMPFIRGASEERVLRVVKELYGLWMDAVGLWINTKQR